MKKLLLLVVGLYGWSGYAQSGVEFHVGGGANLAGQAYETTVSDEDLGGGFLEIHIEVTNNTGADKVWRITRVPISVPVEWQDNLCWPPQCYTVDVSTSTSNPSYTTPGVAGFVPTVFNGTATADVDGIQYPADLKPQITPPQGVAGVGHYRYYVNEGGVYVDSVDVIVNFTASAGIKEVRSKVSFELSPNPANEHVFISLPSEVDQATLKIIDVLGNTVVNERLSASKTVATGHLKTGIYFVMIEGPGIRSTSKKLIVRH